jgi:hypothetical protein
MHDPITPMTASRVTGGGVMLKGADCYVDICVIRVSRADMVAGSAHFRNHQGMLHPMLCWHVLFRTATHRPGGFVCLFQNNDCAK